MGAGRATAGDRPVNKVDIVPVLCKTADSPVTNQVKYNWHFPLDAC